jgi:hypothetical protein
LLEKGADSKNAFWPTIQNKNMWIHWAASSGNLLVLWQLIKIGIDPNWGIPWVALKGQEEAIRFLVQKGATPQYGF